MPARLSALLYGLKMRPMKKKSIILRPAGDDTLGAVHLGIIQRHCERAGLCGHTDDADEEEESSE